VTFGRQYGPALLAHIGTEPRAFKEQFSNLYAWAYNQYRPPPARRAPTATPTTTSGSSSATRSSTATPWALQLRRPVVAGGQSGSTQKNTAWALGATYTGPVILSASYQVIKDEPPPTTTCAMAAWALRCPLAPFTFKANYLNARNNHSNGPTSPT
jgi:predicted porin